MKQQHLHVEVAAESLDAAVEEALGQLDCTRAEVDVDGYRERRRGFLARRLSRKVRQTGKAATILPLVLSDRRVLHELFKQEQGLESHSKYHEGGRKIIILQPLG